MFEFPFPVPPRRVGLHGIQHPQRSSETTSTLPLFFPCRGPSLLYREDLGVR